MSKMATFKPSYLKTSEEKAETARKFDNLHVRPDTSDYEWLDRVQGDCERGETQPSSERGFPPLNSS